MPLLQIKTFFNTSRYLIDKAIEVKKQKDLLGAPELKMGKILDAEIEERVIAFYSEEAHEHIRMLPGKKAHVDCTKSNVFEPEHFFLH